MLTEGMNQIQKFIKEGKSAYIYGTGLWGRNIYQALCDRGISINGFVVTAAEEERLFGLPIYAFSEIEKTGQVENSVFILGLNQHNAKEVSAYLSSHNVEPDKIVSADAFMGNEDVRCGYDENPCIDITTRIGCSVNCKYCPQDVFLRQYYKGDRNRESFMSVDTLVRCIEHMPDNSSFQFAGFVEPFLNPDCVELIRKVCEMGRIVNLYTTLVGLDERKLREVMELPIDFITLHVADEKGYAKIPVTEEYYAMLELIINHKRKDGSPFVGMCNAQAQPDQRVAKICGGNYIISSSLLDRAGNLDGEGLIGKSITTGKITCGVCGSGLNKNELLPDGTLLLCCMDYGMKHVLGNLKYQPYEEIVCGREMVSIKEGMEKDFNRDILCRRCSCANLVGSG